MQWVRAASVVLINEKGEVLLATRPPGKIMPGYAEFPGGKLEAGETPEQAAIREVKEELGVVPRALLPLTFLEETREANPAEGVHEAMPEALHVLVYLYACTQWEGEPRALEGQEIQWVALDRLDAHKLLPANRAALPRIQVLCRAMVWE